MDYIFDVFLPQNFKFLASFLRGKTPLFVKNQLWVPPPPLPLPPPPPVGAWFNLATLSLSDQRRQFAIFKNFLKWQDLERDYGLVHWVERE